MRQQAKPKTPPKQYDVTIEARVRKTVRVKAGNEERAIRQAHELFTVEPDESTPEKYEQETVKVEEV